MSTRGGIVSLVGFVSIGEKCESYEHCQPTNKRIARFHHTLFNGRAVSCGQFLYAQYVGYCIKLLCAVHANLGVCFVNFTRCEV